MQLLIGVALGIDRVVNRTQARERSPHGLHLGVGIVLELFEPPFEVMLYFFSGKAVALWIKSALNLRIVIGVSQK